ncbi:MAG TPA: PIN domain-containing protein [Candidatus Limnocylindrales bacterium]
MVTIDASVLVAAAVPDEPANASARALMERVIEAGLAIHEPTLAVVEVTAAIARRTGDRDLALAAGRRLLQLPGLVLHDLDADVMAAAAHVASDLRLRAADAVYVAVAHGHAGTLITLDAEVRDRSATFVQAPSPTDWLAALATD